MENTNTHQSGDLDALIGDGHLKMMKAALPYMNVPEQRFISLFVKFNELQRTIQLFETEEVAAMGICSAGENTRKQFSPLDMLSTIKPFANAAEQDFIDLIVNIFQGFRLAGAASEPVPGSTVKDQETQENGKRQAASRQSSNPLGRLPFDQLKNFIPPEQQSRLETMQMMVSAMQMMN